MAKKVPVAQSSQPLAVNPFAALELGGLPPGPETVSAPEPEAKKGRVVLRREKSGRNGKTVVIVGDFAAHFPAADLENLARRAKQAVGCGGTLANREIELQGDDPARVRRFFEAEGFRVVGL